MKPSRRFCVLPLLCLTALACSSAPPEADRQGTPEPPTIDEPETHGEMRRPLPPEQWTTFRGDLRRLGVAGTPPKPESPKLRWRFETGGTVESTPTVWRDMVFVGSFSGGLYALDRVSGQLRWRFETDGLVRASPSVANGLVFFGSDDDFFYALDARSGEERWRFQLGPGGEQSSPAVVDGVVYFGAFDHHVYALEAADGTERWRFKTGGGMLSSPAVAEGILYIGAMDGVVYALDTATGELRWRFDDGAGTPIFASPTVAEGTVYIGSYDDHLYALDAAAGNLRWSFRTGGDIFGTAAVAEGRVFFGADDGFYALSADDGEELWHRGNGGRVLASPAVLPEHDLLIVGTSTEGVLFYSLDGRPVDRLDIPDKVWSSVTVDPQGGFYFGSHDRHVYAFNPR